MSIDPNKQVTALTNFQTEWAVAEKLAEFAERLRMEAIAGARDAELSWDLLAQVTGAPSRQHFHRRWADKFKKWMAEP